jgi:hypothetical protein
MEYIVLVPQNIAIFPYVLPILIIIKMSPPYVI